ncbi:MAG: dTDP-4-dehydrorhamnose reductase [Microgenomates group bacterium GW2011_GWA2_37_6]|nr:MAG: dTDP-4-dehydrorhamnose reductase [Microgenomates group bacterium GW2011_GWA2_37_6]
MKTVLFTGATGLLGRYFFKSPPAHFKLIGTYNKNLRVEKKEFFRLDITKKNEVLSLFKKIRPDVVVHAASLGNVDYCETHKKEAKDVNIKGTKNVLSACKKTGAKMIFTSSNAIYDGENPPFSEDSPANPLDYYGKTKIESEKLIKKSGAPFVILRLMTMYGWPEKGGRSNPAVWVIEELKNKRKINVVSDIYNNHLYAGQAVDAVWKVIKGNRKNEIYNIAGEDCVSRFELALEVAEVFKLDASLINPVTSDFFKSIAKRPKNTCFNTRKIAEELDYKPLDINSGLRLMKNEKS